ncbi:hypothetical protein Cylst_5672 [Cylindrospermum stagnale PCC 7417]|uniref:Uncharacterized protein n=1 Tax=Cylindrospermum stagnale PCC 7417 TaxID=56107 RepID=K9X7P0_9NOST|nr:hypothetical protein Cylst_5672 [Cylindrospermum stagnale PCC 7417]
MYFLVETQPANTSNFDETPESFLFFHNLN